MKNFRGYLIVIVSLLACSISLNIASGNEIDSPDTSHSNEQLPPQDNQTESPKSTVETVNVTGKIFFLGLGLEAGFSLSEHDESGIIFGADSTLLGGWLSTGIYYKAFFTDTLYLTQQVSYFTAGFDSYANDGFGYGIYIGNSWKLSPSQRVGVEWGGLSIYHTGSALDAAIHFPKATFTFLL
jgi:hypothetical protein